MTTTTVFVVEKISDATLLRNLLSLCIPSLAVDFYAAQGKLGLASLAGNIAVDLRCPVMIVGDTCTLDPDDAELFEEQHLALMEQLLPPEMVGVFAFSPSLEQVVCDALGIEVEDSTAGGRRSVIAATLLESKKVAITAHPQLAAFLRAVLKLQTAMMPPKAEATRPPRYEHAMK